MYTCMKSSGEWTIRKKKAHWAAYPGIQVFCNFSLCLFDCEWDIVFVENHFLPRTKERLRNGSVVFAHLNLVGRQAPCVRNSGFFRNVASKSRHVRHSFRLVYLNSESDFVLNSIKLAQHESNQRVEDSSKERRNVHYVVSWRKPVWWHRTNWRSRAKLRQKQRSYRYERRIPLGVERDIVKSERDLLAKGWRSILGQTERLLCVLSQG